MFNPGDLKRGLRILVDGDPYLIIDLHVQSPSARGASSLTKVKIRNLRTGQVLDKTFRSGDRIDEPNLEYRAVQFLYSDGSEFHFMDTASYEQIALAGLVTPAAAQPWSGGSAVGLEVRDGKKRPIEGAQVLLRYAEMEPIAGPPPATTVRVWLGG